MKENPGPCRAVLFPSWFSHRRAPRHRRERAGSRIGTGEGVGWPRGLAVIRQSRRWPLVLRCSAHRCLFAQITRRLAVKTAVGSVQGMTSKEGVWSLPAVYREGGKVYFSLPRHPILMALFHIFFCVAEYSRPVEANLYFGSVFSLKDRSSGLGRGKLLSPKRPLCRAAANIFLSLPIPCVFFF